MISLERIDIALRATMAPVDRIEPRLFVLAGVPADELYPSCPYLFAKERRYLSDFLDKSARREMMTDMISRFSEKTDCWCRIEDYLLLASSNITDFFSLHFIKVPYYKNIIPFFYSLEGLERTALAEEDECSTECLSPVFLSDEVCNFLDKSISQLYRVGDELFFTIPESISWTELHLKDARSMTAEASFGKVYTITEDEGSWLLLCRDMWSTIPDNVSVDVFISNDYLKAVYENAVLKLQEFASNVVVLKAEEAKSERYLNEEAETVLKRYWKYDRFRNFQVYRNVRSGGDVLVEDANQHDVIDDILTQAKHAQEGKPYRDVFVTAPTGSGKSVMFQIPSIILHERGLLTFVVSPLIALMNDQIYSLEHKGLNIAATINSSISLSEKESIIQRVQAGEVSVLYLSPESLLSRSDITSLIGGRKIGLLVVDEAHIVTTWGKAFRPDYWYLGNYVQRLRKGSRFPIATFTATAIYKGPEDMYSETRDSLGMRDPITYFGSIPRKNIWISFEHSDDHAEAKTQEYNEVKFSILASRLEEFKESNKKTLVYFPFVSLIDEFMVYLVRHETSLREEDVVKYHGSLDQNEKQENFLKFRNNLTRIMLATKAFGMGVDIPDIDAVYHFAPTGNVCDYVQEIGRAARDESIKGLAKFDYLKKDFTFVNKLHGISTITKYQLLKVMKKVLDIGRTQGYKRNLLISSGDFNLIFSEGGRFSDHDNDNIENKVKTALLIIEKDFLLKLGYSPIVARPRALFTRAYFKAENDRGEREIEAIFGIHQEKIAECWKVDLKGFWEKNYPQYSFARLKYELYSNPAKFGFSSDKQLQPVVLIDIVANKDESSLSAAKMVDLILQFCSEYYQSGKYFTAERLEDAVASILPGEGKVRTEMVVETILNFLDVWNRSIQLNQGKFMTYREDLGYRIIGAGFHDIRDFYNGRNIYATQRIFAVSTSDKKKDMARMFAMLGLFESIDLLNYTVQGGENPEIFVRVNSYYHLQNITRDYVGYNNIILRNVKERHENSVRFLDYLFTNIGDQSSRFWDFIESYFLGFQPDFELGIDQPLVKVTTNRKAHIRLIRKH